MVQISNKKVDEETLTKLKSFLFYLLTHKTNNERFYSVISSLFSKVEILMILKRLGIIYLLLIGIKKYQIIKTLGVTRATTDKFDLIIEKNEDYYKHFKKLIMNEKVKLLFMDLLNTIYGPGTPGVDWTEAKRTRIETERRKDEGI